MAAAVHLLRDNNNRFFSRQHRLRLLRRNLSATH